MAVNPKLIAVIAESLSSEQGRNTVLKIIMVVIGLIMMIFTAFAGFISGLLDIIQTTDLQNHWRYIRTCISEVFDGMNAEIDGDIKREVYDFMPDFSVNLSKAAINSGFDGSTLILYDSEEIAQAQSVMETYAAALRGISSQSEFDEYIADFSSDMDYSDITKPQFSDDTGIERISGYEDSVKSFLYCRAMESMPQYEYLYDETTTEDGKACTAQTLNVTDSTGSTQTVEYTCIGGGTIYLPRFLAMYNVRQCREFLVNMNEQSAAEESLDAQLAEAIGNIPETAEAAEEYLHSTWQGLSDGSGAIKLNVFETSNLVSLLEDTVYDGQVSITTERTNNKLSITLECPANDMWAEIFGIDESFDQYVEDSQNAIELALRDADVPEEEWTLSLDNMVQAALFVYFEGFFELPVDSSALKSGSNGILNQCGEVSKIHKYNYGRVSHDLPEEGITLWLNESVPVYANLLDCGNSIQFAYIYDVWDMENGGHIASADITSNVLNYSAVTIAYVIDTGQFEKDYGFPFPSVDGLTDNGTVTLFVEYSCLASLDGISEEYDIGEDMLLRSDGSFRVGYAHNGTADSTRDFITGTNTWYHAFPAGETIPHVSIKVSIMSGEVSQPQYSQPHYYRGLSATDLGVEVNPRLWFKGFRTGMSDELFATILAVQP